MSYSFSFIEQNKSAAKRRVARELATVINSQPVHAADCHIHQASAYAMIDALEKDTQINGTMNGSVSTIDSLVYGLNLTIGIHRS